MTENDDAADDGAGPRPAAEREGDGLALAEAGLAARGPDVRVLLVERAGCHLCADAHAVLDRVAARTRVGWVSVDVDSSPGLLEAYGELVPVVLVDGRERGHWRLDAAVVEAALRG